MAGTSAFARQVQLFSDQVGELRRQSLIDLARSSLADAEAQNDSVLGAVPKHQTVVDGRQGAAEESVKLGGTIVYLFAVGPVTLERAVDELFAMLAQLSPVRKGAFQRSFRLLVNGAQRDAVLDAHPDSSGVYRVDLSETDEVQITNLQPYARKIERGWSQQAPNGVFEVAATALRQRYGKVLNIKFSYDHFPGFEVGSQRNGGRISRERPKEFRRAALYPTISLSVT